MIRPVFCISLLFLISACDMPKNVGFDWDKVNYAKIACDGENNAKPDCKSSNEDLSAIGRGSKGK